MIIVSTGLGIMTNVIVTAIQVGLQVSMARALRQ